MSNFIFNRGPEHRPAYAVANGSNTPELESCADVQMTTDQTDVPSDQEFKTANEAGIVLFDAVLAMIDEVAAQKSIDPTFIEFSLWVSLTRSLAVQGWTPDELARDAAHYAAHLTSESGSSVPLASSAWQNRPLKPPHGSPPVRRVDE